MPAFFAIWTMEVSDGASDGRKIATENAVPDFTRGSTSCSLKNWHGETGTPCSSYPAVRTQLPLGCWHHWTRANTELGCGAWYASSAELLPPAHNNCAAARSIMMTTLARTPLDQRAVVHNWVKTRVQQNSLAEDKATA